MASSHEVTCVIRTRSHDGSEQVTYVGGQTPQGRGWRLSLQEAIAGILNGRWVFFVSVAGKRYEVQVGVDARGARHLKLGGSSPSGPSLLSLPDCPAGGAEGPQAQA